jgi:hypothetical protein
MPFVPLATKLGIRYKCIPLFGRCRIEGFKPASAASIHLPRFRPIGKFLLAINGTPVCTIEDVSGCFHFHLERKQGLDSPMLLLVSMGVGENDSDQVHLGPQDHAQLRSDFSVTAPVAAATFDAPYLTHLHHSEGGGQSHDSTSMNYVNSLSTPVAVVAYVDAFDTSRFNLVGSIAGSTTAYLVTPKHWGIAMKSLFKRE